MIRGRQLGDGDAAEPQNGETAIISNDKNSPPFIMTEDVFRPSYKLHSSEGNPVKPREVLSSS